MIKLKKESYKSGEKALTKTQVGNLFACTTKLDDLVLIKLAIDTGIRREDVVSIKRNDINIEKGTVTYYQRKKRNTLIRPISNDTIQTISMWLKINNTGWLFPARFEKSKSHLSSRSAYNILRKYTKIAGLPNIPFHALRSTCVKLKQKAGWSVEQTAKYVDDKVSTIQAHYSVPSDEELMEVAKNKPVF